MPWFAPLLAAFGFGALGPIAGIFLLSICYQDQPRLTFSGSLAAGFQAAFGTILGFSILQSAAMGGFGAAIVHGALIVLIIIIGVAITTIMTKVYTK